MFLHSHISIYRVPHSTEVSSIELRVVDRALEGPATRAAPRTGREQTTPLAFTPKHSGLARLAKSRSGSFPFIRELLIKIARD